MYKRVNTLFGFSYCKLVNQLQHQAISGAILSFTGDLVSKEFSTVTLF